jgi:O-acetyl-ADP-ribose deacetylase (regulator of RNase III)
VWHGGNRGEADALASAYRRSLEVAAEAGARSIAFPALSTGIYGFPKRAAAQIAVATLRTAETPIESARLVAFDDETFELYRELVR